MKFDASATTYATDYYWIFDYDSRANEQAHFTIPTATYCYPIAGTFHVYLLVKNPSGGSDTTGREVVVP
jgi:PKD repeat protein